MSDEKPAPLLPAREIQRDRTARMHLEGSVGMLGGLRPASAVRFRAFLSGLATGTRKNPGAQGPGLFYRPRHAGGMGTMTMSGYVSGRRGRGEKVSREAHSSDKARLSDIKIRRQVRRFELPFAAKLTVSRFDSLAVLRALAVASY